jgi:hypothetical protein
MLPAAERFLLWALRQWQAEVALWEACRRLPAGGSALQHGFERTGLCRGLSSFALVMDAFLCGATRPLEIHPAVAPIVSPDEGLLLALFGLAQGGLDAPLAACVSAMLSPEYCPAATVQLKLLGGLMTEAGFGPCCCRGWLQ